MKDSTRLKGGSSSCEAAIERAVSDCDLHLSEIPDLDLYIDQILTLVANKRGESSERYRENLLTKTMINNYSKEGLLMPVKGKKYTREHIVQMLLIYSLKNTLSIGEIHRVLEGARQEGVEGRALMDSYERHLENKEKLRRLAIQNAGIVDCNGELCGENGSDFLVALLNLLCLSGYMRSIALELLEERYPMPAEKDKEKEKDKDKEKEKKQDKKDKQARKDAPENEGAAE